MSRVLVTGGAGFIRDITQGVVYRGYGRLYQVIVRNNLLINGKAKKNKPLVITPIYSRNWWSHADCNIHLNFYLNLDMMEILQKQNRLGESCDRGRETI